MPQFSEIFDAGVISGTISGSRKGFSPEASKVQIRPFEKDGAVLYQFTYLLPDRAAHDNLSASDAARRVDELLTRFGYSQAALFTAEADYHATCFGKLKISKKPPTKSGGGVKSHDRDKPRILDDDFMRALGASGDKRRQIEKFIELAAPYIPDGGTIHVVDFGCGKAYLTFALYRYITATLGRECRMIGVDLKADVLAECEALAARLNCNGLTFHAGDAALFCPDRVDMVVTLHACDTATDYALAWAVERGAKSVVSVPCCQHELFKQVKSEVNSPLLRGILRERISALITDAARAQLLEAYGYKAELIEFIDAGHTPKNIMLRARFIDPPNKTRGCEALRVYRDFADAWGVSPTLEKLLK